MPKSSRSTSPFPCASLCVVYLYYAIEGMLDQEKNLQKQYFAAHDVGGLYA